MHDIATLEPIQIGKVAIGAKDLCNLRYQDLVLVAVLGQGLRSMNHSATSTSQEPISAEAMALMDEIETDAKLGELSQKTVAALIAYSKSQLSEVTNLAEAIKQIQQQLKGQLPEQEAQALLNQLKALETLYENALNDLNHTNDPSAKAADEKKIQQAISSLKSLMNQYPSYKNAFTTLLNLMANQEDIGANSTELNEALNKVIESDNNLTSELQELENELSTALKNISMDGVQVAQLLADVKEYNLFVQLLFALHKLEKVIESEEVESCQKREGIEKIKKRVVKFLQYSFYLQERKFGLATTANPSLNC